MTSRRQFLKLAAGALGAACAFGVPLSDWVSAHAEADATVTWPPATFGRIASWGVEIRESPSLKAKLVRVAQQDEVLRLYWQTTGDRLMPHNDVWYQTEGGYAYSSWIQPVEDIKNLPEPDRAAGKFWGELTVPFSDARWLPDPKSARYMRLYYSSVYRIVAAGQDAGGQWWYRLQDGITWSPGPYVLAAHIRRIDPSDLTPISPDVTNKRVEVNLKEQSITAYENGRPVLTARVASGFGVFYTPSGEHTVLYKTLASRMTGGQGADFYDLPGVPFPTYFTSKGVAIHGTYWHNDYGHPRSHGCVNVPSDVARWFWRWTTPSAPYEAAIHPTPLDKKGTVIKVF